MPHYPGHHFFLTPFMSQTFTEKEIEGLYAKYHPLMEGLSIGQKEDKLVDLVASGEISADVALALSIKEEIV